VTTESRAREHQPPLIAMDGNAAFAQVEADIRSKAEVRAHPQPAHCSRLRFGALLSVVLILLSSPVHLPGGRPLHQEDPAAIRSVD
jgi:hypothetical protein